MRSEKEIKDRLDRAFMWAKKIDLDIEKESYDSPYIPALYEALSEVEGEIKALTWVLGN